MFKLAQMRKVLNWVKSNKLASFLIIVVLFFLLSNFSTRNLEMSEMGGYDLDNARMEAAPSFYEEDIAPKLDITDRMVITNSTLSLVVKDVNIAFKEIKDYIKNIGGYMVNSSQSSPEGPASGNIKIRVPVDNVDDTLEYLRNKAVKVVNENISGTDITDQYIDIEERLKTLEGTKIRYETILDQAINVNEILNVTNQILSIQDQIDNLKGSMKYMESSSNSALITIYLSTDEYELPYAPEQPWRPGVVFKYAVRSLVTNLRGIGSIVIWLGVYAILWVPAVIIFTAIKKRKRLKANSSK